MPGVSAALEMTTGELGATKTYTSRRFVWVPHKWHVDGRLGTLTLVLQRGKRGRGTDDIDSYGVQETGERYPAGVRGFYLKNDTDPEQEDVYECVVGSIDNGLVIDRCTCKAAKCKIDNCKHRDFFNHAIEEGIL